MNSNKIKILVAYHKPAFLLESDVFVPIHVGRDVANEMSKDGMANSFDIDWLNKNCIGDNSGENISLQNRKYSELTALYWAWKNYDKLGNPDYIGLMHYRRHFVLNEDWANDQSKTKIEQCYSILEMDSVSADYQEQAGLNEEKLSQLMSKYDFVSVNECNFGIIGTKSVKDDFVKNIPGVKEKDFDLMKSIINEKYPYLSKYVERQEKEASAFLYQMFIFPRERFFEYMEILFSVLSTVNDRVDFKDYSVNGRRTLGYLGEKIFDCYLRYLRDTTSLRHKTLFCSFIKDTTPEELKRMERLRYRSNLWKEMFYKVLYKVSFGEKRKFYKDKYKIFRQLTQKYREK